MKKIVYSLAAASLLLVQGCAPSQYMVRDPNVSQFQYVEPQSAESAGAIVINDNRPDAEKIFHYGVLNAKLLDGTTEIDPIAYLEKHTARELTARGIALDEAAGEAISINVNKANIRNHRTNGYTPFITFTSLSADVETPTGPQRITAYVKRGKVPVWSFDEIIEPTLNEPLELMVKEFSSKLNLALFNRQASDAHVQALIEKIEANQKSGTVYLDVYELGFTNNPSAVSYLVKQTNSKSEYIRLAAISSLGNLKAVEQLPLLQDIYRNADSWSDRGMALKAIGDLGSSEAIDFLKQAQAEQNDGKKESNWNQEIISLYL